MRIRHAAMLLGAILPFVTSAAGAPETQSIEALLALDLTRLADVHLSLSSRTEEPAFTSAAAVYVLEHEDIVRSGYRHLADVLRLLPGVDVGKGDGNKWAVAVRNGLSRFGTATLVMIDGRHVYTPLNGGVRWESQDLPLDDIERIELLRGPGGPLWGANSVDGIIHIITRHAAQTTGARVEALAGGGEVGADLQARYGAAYENGLAWRISARRIDGGPNHYPSADQTTHGGRRPVGGRALDEGRSEHVNLRADWSGGNDALSLHAGTMRQHFVEERTSFAAVPLITPYPVVEDGRFANLNWQRRLGADESLQARLSAEELDYDQTTLREFHTLVDFDAQHTLRLGPQLITWGLGWRHYRSRVTLPPPSVCGLCFGFYPMVDRNETLSAFAQTQWQARPGLTFTLGSKFERSNDAGFQFQPAVRASWQPDNTQTLWAAWTRPVRTPTRIDRGAAYLNLPPGLVAQFGCEPLGHGVCRIGDENSPTWHVRSSELGYRVKLDAATELDLALFDNRYHLGEPISEQDRRLRSSVHGAELLLAREFGRALRIDASYGWLEGTDTLPDGTRRPVSQLARHVLKFRAHWDPTERWALNATVETRSSSPSYLPAADSRTPASTRLNLRAAWRPHPDTEIALSGLNLLGGRKSEYIDSFRVNTAPRRGVLLGVSHRF